MSPQQGELTIKCATIDRSTEMDCDLAGACCHFRSLPHSAHLLVSVGKEVPAVACAPIYSRVRKQLQLPTSFVNQTTLAPDAAHMSVNGGRSGRAARSAHR